tara:strand:- start:480 stop:1124 length:645 start_codon:yes stop_codon:yes gene_type:complete
MKRDKHGRFITKLTPQLLEWLKPLHQRKRDIYFIKEWVHVYRPKKGSPDFYAFRRRREGEEGKAKRRARDKKNHARILFMQRAYRERNKEKVYAQNRASRKRNVVARRVGNREWYHKNKDYVAFCRIRTKFPSITWEWFQANILRGKCEQCGMTNKEHNKIYGSNLHVDHDHYKNQNQPRGVLCSRHNVAIGFFDDNVLEMEKAIKYIKSKQLT